MTGMRTGLCEERIGSGISRYIIDEILRRGKQAGGRGETHATLRNLTEAQERTRDATRKRYYAQTPEKRPRNVKSPTSGKCVHRKEVTQTAAYVAPPTNLCARARERA